MARRRTMNYREMRADFDEDEERRGDEEEGDEEEDDDDEEEEGEAEAEPGAEAEEGEEEGDEEEAPVKKKKKPKPKPKRTRTVKTTRMRVIWGVFNNSHQMVASFEYPKKGEAESHAAKLMADKKSTHFVQPIKEPIVEEKKEK
jgi:hypothetical protein